MYFYVRGVMLRINKIRRVAIAALLLFAFKAIIDALKTRRETRALMYYEQTKDTSKTKKIFNLNPKQKDK